MKFGCCIKIKNIPLAKKFGYDFVELSAREIMNISDIDWPLVKNYILQQNIIVLGFNSFCDENNPLIGPLSNPNKWDYLNKVISRASELNCINIGIGAPKARMIPQNYDYDVATEEMIQFLSRAALIAKPYNINILYEAINPKECNFCNSTIESVNTIRKINASNLYIVYDVYHAVNSDENFIDCINYLQYIKHIHINSWDKNLNRYYLYKKDKKYITEFLKLLFDSLYTGTISIEADDDDFQNTGKTALDILTSTQKILIQSNLEFQ